MLVIRPFEAQSLHLNCISVTGDIFHIDCSRCISKNNVGVFIIHNIQKFQIFSVLNVKKVSSTCQHWLSPVHLSRAVTMSLQAIPEGMPRDMSGVLNHGISTPEIV
jgi:hypothetical protein